MEIRRSKIKELIEYKESIYIVNLVIEKSRKGWQGKSEKYNVVFTAYNNKAKDLMANFKVGDTVNVRFRIKSYIKPRRIQTVLIIENVEIWQKIADKIAEKMAEKVEERESRDVLDNDMDYKFE